MRNQAIPYPAHQPTEKLRGKVEALVSFGLPHKDIAKEIGISHETLYKYYRDELDNGKVKACAKVAQTLYRLAIGDPKNGVPPDRASCMFWLKTQAGWRETNRLELEHSGGVDVTAGPKYDFSQLTDMELAAYEALEAKLTGGPTGLIEA